VGAADAFLAVYLTTLRPHSDRTCIIRPGEHPFVQHDTCAAYNETRRLTAGRLEELIRERQAVSKQPVSPELLERLREGLLASPRTPHAITAMAREEFGAGDELGD
jgi:hypothetical protein